MSISLWLSIIFSCKRLVSSIWLWLYESNFFMRLRLQNFIFPVILQPGVRIEARISTFKYILETKKKLTSNSPKHNFKHFYAKCSELFSRFKKWSIIEIEEKKKGFGFISNCQRRGKKAHKVRRERFDPRPLGSEPTTFKLTKCASCPLT